MYSEVIESTDFISKADNVNVLLFIRSKRHFGTCAAEDDVGDISISEDSFTETTSATPQVRCLYLMSVFDFSVSDFFAFIGQYCRFTHCVYVGLCGFGHLYLR